MQFFGSGMINLSAHLVYNNGATVEISFSNVDESMASGLNAPVMLISGPS